MVSEPERCLCLLGAMKVLGNPLDVRPATCLLRIVKRFLCPVNENLLLSDV